MLNAELLSGPTHGTLTLNASGSFTYTPTTGYSGADSFAYTAANGAGFSDTATVNLRVGPALTLVVFDPAPEGGLRAGDEVLIVGTATASDGTEVAVTVNGMSAAAIDVTGRFFAPIILQPGVNIVTVVATSADGATTETQTITVFGRVPDPSGIDFGGLGDVTAALRPEYGRTSFHMGTEVLYTDLTARHIGSDAVRTSLLAAVYDISSVRVTTRGFDGVTQRCRDPLTHY